MKKIMMKIVVALFLLSINGCAGSPIRLATLSPEELKNESSDSLCNAYAYSGGRSENLRAELNQRSVIGQSDWQLIDQKKIGIGMSELAVLCSWGKPGLFGYHNEIVNGMGVTKYWQYKECQGCKATLVTISNGTVQSYAQ